MERELIAEWKKNIIKKRRKGSRKRRKGKRRSEDIQKNRGKRAERILKGRRKIGTRREGETEGERKFYRRGTCPDSQFMAHSAEIIALTACDAISSILPPSSILILSPRHPPRPHSPLDPSLRHKNNRYHNHRLHYHQN